jgi:hypothetical protein
MIPDYHTRDTLVIQHRQHLMQEAEHERMLAVIDSQRSISGGLLRLAGKLGIFLIVLGSKLQQFEQQSEVVTTPAKSR